MKTDRTTVQQELLFDPQTSGGLLLSLPAARVDDVLAALKQAGVEDAVCIGNVVSDSGAFVKVV